MGIRNKERTVEAAASGHLEEDLLHQKTDLAILAIDHLMFEGEGMGAMARSMGAIMGLPAAMSISLILPTKNRDNMRPFLDCLSSIINTARDDQCDLPEFTRRLFEATTAIRAIAEGEK